MKEEPAVDPPYRFSAQDSRGPLDSPLVYCPHLVAQSPRVFGESTFFGAKDGLNHAFLRSSLQGRKRDNRDRSGDLVGDLAGDNHTRAGFWNLSPSRRVQRDPDDGTSYYEGQPSLSTAAKSWLTRRDSARP